MTALRDREEARSRLLDDALRAAPIVEAIPGPIVDVGSGGGSPGIPLAALFRSRRVTLLEASRRKCDFLRRFAAELENVEVVWGRAEEHDVGAYGVALAKALARPPVAAELCLPLVRTEGAAIVWVGKHADMAPMAAVAERLGASLESAAAGLVVLRKLGPTPAGFPRRAGMAKKRPLA